MTQFTVQITAQPDPLVRTAVAILARELEERAGVPVREGSAQAKLVLTIEPGVGPEGFRIDGPPAGPVVITGHDARGLLYGLGKFLHTSSFAPGRFTPSLWRGVSVPKREVRAIYFASHFFNFYHSAPLAEVERYLEELALWGCNTLSVWFDMHHYQGIDDPEAQAMLARLRAILHAGNRVGMGASLTALANEGYADSPEELRAEWTGEQNGYHSGPIGHFHREICPSKPGGLEYILRTRREVLEAFSDIDIRYHWIWPYDQGGCTCAQCTPWGGNGFLRTADVLAPLIGELVPQAEIVLCTWLFDRFIDGEWAAFDQAISAKRPPWLRYLLADTPLDDFPPYLLQHGVPGQAKLVNFPEISMYYMHPWGSYGVNPLPMHLQAIWESMGERIAGGFPYSEGIFEDINKVINLQHYWDGRHAVETVRAYAAYEFGAETAEEVTDVVLDFERHHHHYQALERETPNLAARLFSTDENAPTPYHFDDLNGAEERCARLQRVDAALPTHTRAAWRWRLLYLRAIIDAELLHTGGRCSAELDDYFEELIRIYHAENAYWCVCPPSRRMLLRFFVEGEIAQH